MRKLLALRKCDALFGMFIAVYRRCSTVKSFIRAHSGFLKKCDIKIGHGTCRCNIDHVVEIVPYNVSNKHLAQFDFA